MTIAFVFCYERPDTLQACVNSLFLSDELPDNITFIDDGSKNQRVIQIINDTVIKHGSKTQLDFIQKTEHRGFSDSAVIALKQIREKNPDYVYFIESDVVFEPKAFNMIQAAFNHTPQGRECLGIAGYNHWNYRVANFHTSVFPHYMRLQIGEDNVNRSILHKPFGVTAGPFSFNLEFVSNTCFSCYLNWKNIRKVEAEFPGLADLIDQACAPRKDPPHGAGYMAKKVVDDGMLSHGISFCWNQYALKHGLDRQNLAAWLNITPGVANHHSAGGMHG